MQLSDNDEQLIADFVADFAERFRNGEDVSLQGYLERLPTEEMRQEFQVAANASRFISVMEQARKDDVSARRIGRKQGIQV